MKPVVGRFVFMVLIFAAWIGYLGYLVLTKTDPVVVSRPQMMLANFTIVAEVSKDPRESSTVTVREVRGPQRGASDNLWKSFPKVDSTITIENLGDSQGWSQPGEYIIPMVFADEKREKLAVAPVPRPLTPSAQSPVNKASWPKFWIYPANSNARAQMQELTTEK